MKIDPAEHYLTFRRTRTDNSFLGFRWYTKDKNDKGHLLEVMEKYNSSQEHDDKYELIEDADLMTICNFAERGRTIEDYFDMAKELQKDIEEFASSLSDTVDELRLIIERGKEI